MDNRDDYVNIADVDYDSEHSVSSSDNDYPSGSESEEESDGDYDNGLSEKEMIGILEEQFTEQFGKIVDNIQIKNVCVDTDKIQKHVKQTVINIELTINGEPYDIDSEITFISNGFDYSTHDVETTYSDAEKLIEILRVEYKEKLNSIMYEIFEMIM